MFQRMLEEYRKFILRGNVVDLAVGVVIGAAFGEIVSALVADLFMPVLGILTGGFDVSGQSFGYKDAQFRWGHFLQKIINFLIIGFCMFLVVKAMNALMKKAPPALPEPTPSEKLLTEIRDLLKDRK